MFFVSFFQYTNELFNELLGKCDFFLSYALETSFVHVFALYTLRNREATP